MACHSFVCGSPPAAQKGIVAGTVAVHICEGNLNLRLEPRDFWTWRGKVGRAKYAGLGLFLFAIKHNLDRIVASDFGYSWTILDYWIFDEHRIFTLSHRRAGFYATLVLLALPFIWIGVVLTTRRLRDANLPVWLVVLFFVPFANLVFFLLLSAFPSASSETANYGSFGLKLQRTLSAVIPNSEFGSAAMGILITVVLAVLFTFLSVYGMGQYGWGLFLGIPFFLGLNSVLIYGFHRARSFGKCVAVSIFSVLLAGAILFAIAIEGVICLIMAAPLAIVLALIGGIIGYFIQRRDAAPPVHVFTAVLIVLPGFIVLEPLAANTPPQYQVRTSVIINANRAGVWKHVVSFSQLPPPAERLFQTGIAYPIRAEIEGAGRWGRASLCVFNW